MIKVCGEKIQTLLDWGFVVESRALGRMGSVVKTDGEAIYVKNRFRNTTGVTSFVSGDPVKFVFLPDYIVHIVNEGMDF